MFCSFNSEISLAEILAENMGRPVPFMPRRIGVTVTCFAERLILPWPEGRQLPSKPTSLMLC